MFYQYLIKPILFKIDPEKAHHLTNSLFGFILKIPIIGWLTKASFRYENDKLRKTLWGLDFPNPVGLAAGFDKDGKHYKTMAHLGFGFIEIGTVTPKAQDGNPKQRLFRLPKDRALINRMGFNNEGVDTMVSRLRKRKKGKLIVGGNIGKNKATPNEEAIHDYEYAFEKLYDHVDYFVVNVSSPNTPGLRELQDKEPLSRLLNQLLLLRKAKKEQKPLLLKIAPDLNSGQIQDILQIIEEIDLDGIIVSNTTIDRSGLKSSQEMVDAIGNGGLSGAPLTQKSRDLVKLIRDANSEIKIIGVGGINTEEDALKMLQAGADLIQVYSGLVYQGPDFVKRIKKYLVDHI